MRTKVDHSLEELSNTSAEVCVRQMPLILCANKVSMLCHCSLRSVTSSDSLCAYAEAHLCWGVHLEKLEQGEKSMVCPYPYQ